jgi:predicted Rossmann fold nucleotide-binding protein DprA/Smf involved in DNA uptake
VNPAYPLAVRKRLGLDAPGSLWIKGDVSLLNTPMVALVGSRQLNDENPRFAEAVGREAAKQNLTLISGNARGADTVAQEACLAAGGKVVSVVADCLAEHTLRPNITYISELGYDLPFSSIRALSRNRVIHALGYITVVAQCNLGFGGTWDGTVRNLKGNWSPVFCLDDGSPAAIELEQLGAKLIDQSQLSDFSSLHSDTPRMF